MLNHTVVAALTSLLGVLLGAVLHHLSTRASKEREALLKARTEAYASYLMAVTAKGRVSTDDVARSRVLARIDNAKFRICIYGSAKVIAALAAFEGSRTDATERVLRTRFLELCEAMRADAGNRSRVPSNHLAAVFGRKSQAVEKSGSGDPIA